MPPPSRPRAAIPTAIAANSTQHTAFQRRREVAQKASAEGPARAVIPINVRRPPGARGHLGPRLRRPPLRSRRPPAPLAQQQHRRRQDQDAYDEGVQQDGRSEHEPDLLHLDDVQEDEAHEHRRHHDRRAGHHARRPADPVEHRLRGRGAREHGLPDPADDEHLVVHGESEEDHEQEQRDPRPDRPGGAEVQQPLGPGVLEDEDQQPERGRRRQQVQRHADQPEDDGAERVQRHQEGHQQQRPEDERQFAVLVRRIVGVPGHVPADAVLGAA